MHDCVRAPLAARHSWLGFAAWVCVLGFGYQLCPATPGWAVWVCVCSCARSACIPPLLARVCGVGVCVWARVPAAPRHSWLGCWCVRDCVRAPPCSPPLLAGVCGVGVCGWARVSVAPRHSWLGCWGVCVLVCPLRLHPATPGWGVRCGCVSLGSAFGWDPPRLVGVLWCLCLCACSPCTPPLLAGACGVGVCVWVRVSAGPRHSWLGCWGVCVLVWALSLYHATPGWGVRCGCVCLGSGFGCAPPLLGRVLGCACLCACSPCTPPLQAGVCGVGVCAWTQVSAAPRHSWFQCWGVSVGVRAPLVPRHSWLEHAAWVCVFGFGLRLRPATSGWGVGMCVCWCGRSACTPPLLAGVCGVGVCVWARFLAAPRHPWLRCWGVPVCVRASPLTPPLLAGVCGVGVCAWARVSAAPRHSCLRCWGVSVCGGVHARLVPRHSWLLEFACWCACSACTPPLLAGLCDVGVRAWARVSAAPRHCWPGCCGVRVLVCVLLLYPATPGWDVRCRCVCSCLGFCCAPPLLVGVLGSVCLCARSACTPPLLAGVCGVWVGFCLAPVPVPWFVACCARCPGLRHPVAVVAWHLPLCLGCGLRRAFLACPVAPRWSAAPRPVRSLSVRRSAFLTPCRLSPPGGRYWVAARATRRPAENRAHCVCRWTPQRQGRWARSASYPFGAPGWGCPWRVAPASVLGCVRCGVLRVWTRSLTRPVSRTARLSTGDSAGAPGLFCVDANTAPFGLEDATPESRGCVRVRAFLAGSGGPASWARFGAPHLYLWPFLLLSLSARPPAGWGCPACVVSGFFFSPLLCACLVSGIPCFPALVALGLGVLWSFPPPSFV